MTSRHSASVAGLCPNAEYDALLRTTAEMIKADKLEMPYDAPYGNIGVKYAYDITVPTNTECRFTSIDTRM